MSTDKHWVATDFGGMDKFAFVDAEVPVPGAGEVTIEVRAAGMNPADYKHTVQPSDRPLPIPIGYELAGVISAVGNGTDFQVGDEVLAYRVSGGYATRITVAASNVFRKPSGLSFPEAANLLLAGATAMESLHVTKVKAGDTVLVHGASGAVGVSILQQARMIGARVIGTASEANFDEVRRFGGEPVVYGPGLEDRVRDLAGEVDAAIDTVGTPEAAEVSIALVPDRQRIVTIANQAAAKELGILAIGGAMPASAVFRDEARSRLVALAASGDLVVPVARTFPLADAREALEVLKGGHPGGKLALLP
ncbi:MAG: NADP-dependent oxidoreductase [Actinomycetota bacterium]